MRQQFKYLSLILLFLLQINLIGQNKSIRDSLNLQSIHRIDSLQKELKICKLDTQKVNILDALADEYYYNDESNYLKYINQVLAESKRIDFKPGIILYYHSVGLFQDFVKNNPAKALDSYNSMLKISEENGNFGELISAHFLIAGIYVRELNYARSLEHLFKAVEIADKIKDANMRIRLNYSIGQKYSGMQKHQEALKFFEKSEQISRETKDTLQLMSTLSRVADSYAELGEVSQKSGNIKKSKECFFKAREKFDEALKLYESGLKTTYRNIELLSNIGKFEMYQKNYPKALENYNKVIRHLQEIGDSSAFYTQIHIGIGDVLVKQGKYEEALKNYSSFFAKRHASMRWVQKKRFKGMAEAYEQLGNHKEALYYHKLFTQLQDSISGNEATTKVTMLQNEIQNEKEDQIRKIEEVRLEEANKAESKKQKLIILSVGLGLVFVLIFALFIFRSLRITRKQKDIIETSKAELQIEKQKVDTAHKDIKDSINYAKRIQVAHMPTDKYIEKKLKDLKK